MYKIFLLAAFTFWAPISWAQDSSYVHIPLSNSAMDSARVMQATKLNEPCAFLTAQEKELIQWMNIARMYPKWFLHFRAIKNIDPTYTKTLIETMQTMKPIKEKLVPDAALFEMAQCHAQSAGSQGYMGHERQDPLCKKGMSAECIHYGGGNMGYKIERLLIDKGVPSLGHRMAILNSNYHFVGVSLQVFSKPPGGQIAVIDFGRKKIATVNSR